MQEGWFQVVLEVFSEQFDLLHYVTSELFHFPYLVLLEGLLGERDYLGLGEVYN